MEGFDVKKAIQEQLKLLIDCDDRSKAELLKVKIEILIGAYTSGVINRISGER